MNKKKEKKKKKSLEVLSQAWWYNLDASWRVILNVKLERKQREIYFSWLADICIEWERMKKRMKLNMYL